MNTMHSQAAMLREKMKKSGRYQQIDEDTYRALQRAANEKLIQKETAAYVPDWDRLGIREDESQLTWSAVKPGASDGMKGLEAVKPAYEKGYGIIFLWGAWGQAKTLIGKILVATAFRDGKRTAYANMLKVLDDIRLAFDSDEHKTTELIRKMNWWCERDVLFLDELDKTNSTTWAQERMFELLDRRYQMAVREEGLTVIASNKSTDALDGYLKSRLHDRRVSQIVELRGVDGRLVVPTQQKF
jgi:DNA replication protein DnaC